METITNAILRAKNKGISSFGFMALFLPRYCNT
jgi:hypothetical protein